MVVIKKVMYTEHCENTLRIEAIECILIDSGVCALAGCTHFIILHKYFKIYLLRFWVFKFDVS